jgi:hypothetical protein
MLSKEVGHLSPLAYKRDRAEPSACALSETGAASGQTEPTFRHQPFPVIPRESGE